jgi:hypothetical protein
MCTPNIYWIHILQVINAYVHFSNVENDSTSFIHTFDVQKLSEPKGESEKFMKHIVENVWENIWYAILILLCLFICVSISWFPMIFC